MGPSSQIRGLLRPVRPTVIGRHLGRIGVVLWVLVAVPTLVALGSGDGLLAQRLALWGLLPGALLAVCALIRAPDDPIRANEALVVVALAFIAAAGLIAYPLTAAGLSPLDAWFESVSGVTTTGLTMASDPEQRSDAFLFTRAWMQWFGGLEILALLVHVYPGTWHKRA
jgi:trk system potassium uptake protein TrkH